MTSFFKVLFQDPILLAAALVLVSAVLVLLWALNSMKKLQESSFEPPREEKKEAPMPAIPENENTGLFEARLHEISNQLAIISQRLSELEKRPGPAASINIDNMTSRIESKIEGIHKLLVLLTDSGASDQK